MSALPKMTLQHYEAIEWYTRCASKDTHDRAKLEECAAVIRSLAEQETVLVPRDELEELLNGASLASKEQE